MKLVKRFLEFATTLLAAKNQRIKKRKEKSRGHYHHHQPEQISHCQAYGPLLGQVWGGKMHEKNAHKNVKKVYYTVKPWIP